jgi:helix-hairpin-helix protein
MIRWALVAALLGAAWLSAEARELAVLAPLVENGKAVEKADAGGKAAPVLTRMRSGALFDLIQREASDGFVATMLALDEAAQRAAGATTIAPLWLYLSEEEGGFARVGFWLREDGADRYVPDPFVDLVVDEKSVREGDFEEIFSHETGHVFLRRLLPGFPPQAYSRAPHGSLTVTDYPTAFDEGFAIHFQGLARRMTRNARLHETDLGLASKPFLGYWQSNIDRAARIDGVRRNAFVQRQLVMPGSERALVRRDQSTLFDSAHLKNGNQMMASEGVLATLFYRWLVAGPAEESAIVERYARFFAAVREIGQGRIESDTPLYLRLVEAYARRYPEDGARVVGLTIDTTYAATFDRSIAAQAEALAVRGRSGDMEGFVAALAAARKALEPVRYGAMQSPAQLGAALGADLWLLGHDASAGAKDGGKVAVNLNTAELEYLATLPGLDAMHAAKALASRRGAGPFRDLDDFAARAGVEAPGAAKLRAAMAAMRDKGTYERR